MNRDPHESQDASREQAMLEHFRNHSLGEPGAELDARILAAARAAQAADKRGWTQRLHGCLFGHSGRQRWSVAMAGLACVGIGASLTWRTLEQTPERYDEPIPHAAMAPAAAPATSEADAAYDMAREQAPAPRMQAYSSARKAEDQQAAPVLMEQASKPAPEALADSAERSLSATAQADRVVEPEAEKRLLQLLELRRAGKVEEALSARQRLQKAYPQLDIDANLERIERANPIPQ
ncbi:hypothetical protein ACX0MV_10740 [Pseudomonas borbori]